MVKIFGLGLANKIKIHNLQLDLGRIRQKLILAD